MKKNRLKILRENIKKSADWFQIFEYFLAFYSQWKQIKFGNKHMGLSISPWAYFRVYTVLRNWDERITLNPRLCFKSVSKEAKKTLLKESKTIIQWSIVLVQYHDEVSLLVLSKKSCWVDTQKNSRIRYSNLD